eukprot:gene13722-29184_t
MEVQLDQDNGRPASTSNKKPIRRGKRTSKLPTTRSSVDQFRQQLQRGTVEHMGTAKGGIGHPERTPSDAMVDEDNGVNLLEVGAVILTTLVSVVQ